MKLLTALFVTVAAAFPTAASADSIAYIKGGDVYLSTSDGARQHRVTDTHAYADVTQADDGTLIALTGVRLHRLDRAGNVLADFDTPVSDTRPEGQRVFYGPWDPAISPDGTKLSYTYYYVGKGTAPGCHPPTCMTTVTEGGTGYSYADRQTAWDVPGLGRHSGWRHASWVDDRTTMISDPTHLPNADVLLDVVGDTGVPIMDWFSDNGTQHLGAGEMTRQRTKLAFQAGEGDTELRVYRMPGHYPALPEPCYRYTGEHVGAPTWAPDATRLAWADAQGVKVVDVPDLSGGCTQAGASPEAKLILPGASQPDWGPADVPAGAGRTETSGPTAPAPTPPATTNPPLAPQKQLALSITSRRKGVAFKVAVPSKGKVTVKVTKGRKTIKTSSKTVTTSATFKLKFKQRGKVKLTVTHQGRTVTRTVTVR